MGFFDKIKSGAGYLGKTTKEYAIRKKEEIQENIRRDAQYHKELGEAKKSAYQESFKREAIRQAHKLGRKEPHQSFQPKRELGHSMLFSSAHPNAEKQLNEMFSYPQRRR